MSDIYKYDNNFSKRLAVFCSDERFIKPTVKFMDKSLNIRSCDLFILPGGPEPIASGKTEIIKRLGLLIDAHKIREVSLISHEGCGYYKKLYKNNSLDWIFKKQLEDLDKATRKIKELFPGIETKVYYCKIKDKGSVYFKRF